MLEKLQGAADHLVEDLKALMDGSWEPDNESCQASIDNAVLIAGTMPRLVKAMEFLEMVSRMTTKEEDEAQGQNFGDQGSDVETLSYVIVAARKLTTEIKDENQN